MALLSYGILRAETLKSPDGNIVLDFELDNGVPVYKVDYKGNYVTKVKSVEIVKSDDSEYLNTLKEQTENIYSAYNNIENYNYKTEINGNTFTSTVDIDYEKIDTEKLISIDSSNSQLIKNGKIDINDIKNIYESIGATCK